MRAPAWLLLPLLALSASGCVTVYHPLSVLHRPVVVDPQVANFAGLNLTVRCVPTGFLDRTRADLLCRKLATLFGNQGAKVHTVTRLGAEAFDMEESEEGTASRSRRPPADLTIELRARILHLERNPILWAISFATLTILPAVNEYTFAQDVTIRDREGFLLLSDTMEARFVRYFGLGAWVGNSLLDLAVREESEKLTGKRAAQDFSKDFYGQLSQMLFNAKMRSQVLYEAEAQTAIN